MTEKSLLSPFQKFVKIESFSGLLLLAATVLALVWSNSPFADSYTALWDYKVGITTEAFELNKPLILWINDGLMAIFFFLIGLEIKREFLIGELNSPKKIGFPLVGAFGGMVIPVLCFFLINNNPETLKGWGIPMATDIAFSLAILTALGKRIPLSLKVFLTAFAIVDDLGAVLVIAIFYSSSIKFTLLGVALLLLVFLYLLSHKGIYSKFFTISLGIVIWILFLKSGIHPTLAGVLLAFSVPIRQKINTQEFINTLVSITDNIKQASILNKPILSKEQIQQIDDLEDWTYKYQSPLQQIEHNLHDWVAYFIIPVFAFANAGVIINSSAPLEFNLVTAIVVSLVLGKSIGITLFVVLAQKIKLINIPNDISIWHIIGVSFLAGIGFTMSIFIAGLAFVGNPINIDSAKIGILIGSLISAIIGFLILKFKK
ncbi:Na+/H+ antiporter NhaA [Mangrovimonas spongiae]|uniref:Na(+)/H(+) antiporter NhaA n=1 Tax=Mangrovimonas spongiae TaxID=2494697 RepID=A0A3R9PM47_9FLAO|nr:Na+/H+ antiporter NhaA [Mangrovimonas spongiae]RSK41448.1 Na+/H+ antiporter NhaA [Mangrovimonas spongiae]